MRSVNRDMLDKLDNKLKADYIPRWYVYFEKMHTSDTFLSDTTSASLLSLVLLAANISYLPLPATEFDTLDKQTKMRYVILPGRFSFTNSYHFFLGEYILFRIP